MATGKSMKIQYKLGGKVMGKSSNIIELNGGFPIAMFDYWSYVPIQSNTLNAFGGTAKSCSSRC